jgi:regulator of replication initiation timing
MTDAPDVLVKWAALIEDSKDPCDEVEEAFLDLAAEVRALRTLYEKSLNHNVWLEDELEKLRERLVAQEPRTTRGRLVQEGWC